jgi:hypothetical protein
MKEEDGVKGYWAGGELGCQLGLRGKGREEGCGPEKGREAHGVGVLFFYFSGLFSKHFKSNLILF